MTSVHQFADGQIFPAADIEQRRIPAAGSLESRVRQVHQENRRIREVFAVKKLAADCPGAPNRNGRPPLRLGLMDFPDQRGEDMAGRQVEVVTRSVEIGRHHGKKPGPILLVIRPAHLDPRDLGYGIGTVGGLQRTGEQILLFNGLRAVTRVDTRRTQEQQPAHSNAGAKLQSHSTEWRGSHG